MTVTRKLHRQPLTDAKVLRRMASHLAQLARRYPKNGLPGIPASGQRLAVASAYVKEIAELIAPKEPHGPPSNR